MRDISTFIVSLGSFAITQLQSIHAQVNPHIQYEQNYIHINDVQSLRGSSNENATQICGTAEPSLVQSTKSMQITQEWKKRSMTRQYSMNQVPIEVPTYFHVIKNGSEGNNQAEVDDSMIALNNAYKPHFTFNLIETTITDNESWFSNISEEEKMKRALRQGGCNVLNVYSTSGYSFLGYANLPHQCESNSSPWVFDGVVIHYASVPGGYLTNYNEGDTLIHEVGHWLGLLHTFQNGCDGDGDFIDDTPAHISHTECKVENSCPSKPGNDPVNNFMNYTPDTCMDEFTKGQYERMIAHWNFFRSCEDDPNFTFDNGDRRVGCDWLSALTRANYCNQNVNGRIVQDACPKSCDVCKIVTPLSENPSTAPSLSPSEGPSRVSTPEASAQPTGLKIVTPLSENPSTAQSISSETTSEPEASAQPTGLCLNDISYRYEGAKKKSCRWIRHQYKRYTRLCKMDEVVENCPLSCGVCCEDDAAYTFRTEEGRRRVVGCDWLSTATTGYYCDKYKSNRMVRDACPKSCNFCISSPSISSETPSLVPSHASTLSIAPSTSSEMQSLPPTTSISVGPSADSTPSASALSSGGCLNNNLYRYKGAKKKSCRWIRHQYKRYSRLCKMEEVAEHCPLSCGECCEDDENYTFRNGIKYVGCDWLSTATTDYFCGKYLSGQMVRDACAKTCDFCVTKQD